MICRCAFLIDREASRCGLQSWLHSLFASFPHIFMAAMKELLTGLQELQKLLVEDKLSYLEMEQVERVLDMTFPLQAAETEE